MIGFITMASGRYVRAMHLRPEDVCIEDVAHHLALTNRFRGATRFPISVAQHAVYVARIVADEFKKTALHHDDHEAYTGDCPSPMKGLSELRGLREIEERNQLVINAVFNVPHPSLPLPAEVHEADMIMRAFEARFCHPNVYNVVPQPSSEDLVRIGEWEPWSWARAEMEFLKMAKHLS